MNVFIIHSFGGGTKETFGPYIVDECRKLGIDTYFPDFPTKESANYNSWSKVLDYYLENNLLNENTIIIAHSIATNFIPKYLSNNNIKIKVYISCAGFLHKPNDRPDLENAIKEFKPDNNEIKKLIELTDKRYAIYSNNDPISSIEQSEKYADTIKAKKVFVLNAGHMGKLSKIRDLKEVVEIIKENI